MTRSFYADLVVIGSGPAGVTVAREITKLGLSVLIVPGGARRESSMERELHLGRPTTGPWSHEPLEENRRRMIGGTSSVWGGRCVPLDPIDFQQRDWISDSGWPISYKEYWEWAPEAARILAIGSPAFQADNHAPLLPGKPDAGSADPPEIEDTSLERWSPPVKFARLLRSEPTLQSRCRVLDDAHAVTIECEGNAIVGVSGRTLRDREPFLARGRRYVLAAGALENARLLLANGFGAELPSVGRYYMSHTYGTVMPVQLAAPLSPQTALLDDDGVYIRRRFRLDETFQEQAKVGNAIAYFGRPPADSMAAHRDPLTSVVAIGKAVRMGIRLGPNKGLAYLRDAKQDLKAHASVIVRSDRSFWTEEVPLLYKRFGRYRRPLVAPKLDQEIQYLTFQGEHLPTRDSRVYLTRERDALDVPRLAIDVRFSDGDFATLEALHGSLSRTIEAAGGVPQLSVNETVASIKESMAHSFNSMAHNLGTTRMGTSKIDSVVDRDCKVHTVDNLFVAGSSVFPTGGHANPTLSIVMLACRLADHLSKLDWK